MFHKATKVTFSYNCCCSLDTWCIRYNQGRNYQKQSPEVFCKKGVFENFAKFTGKYLCQSLFLTKLKTLIKLFSCEFCEIFWNTCLIQQLWTTSFEFFEVKSSIAVGTKLSNKSLELKTGIQSLSYKSCIENFERRVN